MDLQEHITRERIALRELKAAVIGQIEREIGKTIERLDDLELRLEKEKLTGGEPTFKLNDAAPGTLPASGSQPAGEDTAAPVDAADVIGSLAGKPRNGVKAAK
jgi:hypothetical protein